MMKLYISLTSPYARIARIMVREKRLADQVEEIVAQTRTADSPYYAINPSGRIPFLTGPEGLALEGSVPIAHYFDGLDGHRILPHPSSPVDSHLEEKARSLMDGLAVWGRELKRPEQIQSTKLLSHEEARAERLTEWWEARVEHAALLGPLNITQITLATALDMEHRITGFAWRDDCPGLARWQDALTARASFRDTAVPDGSALG